MPVSSVTIIPSGFPGHQHSHNNDNTKYRQKYKKLKELVKETIFVSNEHNCIIFWCVLCVKCDICLLSSIDSDVNKAMALSGKAVAKYIGLKNET